MRSIKLKEETEDLVVVSNLEKQHLIDDDGKIKKPNLIADAILQINFEHLTIYESHKIVFLCVESAGWLN